MNKTWLIFIIISVLFICGINITVLLFTKKQDSIQKIVLINPATGNHVVGIPTNKNYARIKIYNYTTQIEKLERPGTQTFNLAPKKNVPIHVKIKYESIATDTNHNCSYIYNQEYNLRREDHVVWDKKCGCILVFDADPANKIEFATVAYCTDKSSPHHCRATDEVEYIGVKNLTKSDKCFKYR